MNRTIVFDTTHYALWAEEIAKDRGIAVEIVPAPESADAKCGMALEVLAESYDKLKDELGKEGVPFKEIA